jgi:hypothetical protein
MRMATGSVERSVKDSNLWSLGPTIHDSLSTDSHGKWYRLRVMDHLLRNAIGHQIKSLYFEALSEGMTTAHGQQSPSDK